MKLMLLYFSGFLIGLGTCQFTCPNNGIPFDYQNCDPEKRSECPSGFTCRSINSTNNSTVHLCCESGSMTISDWLTERQLYPNIIPQVPYSSIETVQLSPINSNFNFPPINIGDEVVTLSFPNYITGIIQSIALNRMIDPGYVHVVTVIDALYKPFAVLLNHNIPIGQPTQFINVTSSQRFIAYLDESTSLPNQTSYRALYTVLVYYTPAQVYFDGTTPQQMILGSCADSKCLFSNSPFSAKLNQPTAGTIFYLTTSKTIFAINGSSVTGQQNSSNNIYQFSFLIFFFCKYFC